ncbi:unnamed protein product, partial [marine sediment metagenome]
MHPMDPDKLARYVSVALPPRPVADCARLRDTTTQGIAWEGVERLMNHKAWIEARPSFLLSGPRGCGKTTALCRVGIHEIACRRNVEYVAVTRFASVLKAGTHDRMNMHRLESADLLLIDELHRFGGLPAWVQSEIVGLIDLRYSQLQQMGAAGTLPIEPLADMMGREVVERF